ncbi:MAG: PASTA domain-containing protein [Sulfurimicrobium sp.]|nr:PASTA domain-containing protein [Sulfurimicrobium sp.]
MPGIFISYRREDTAGHAGRIFDRLREKFGLDKVFMDVAGIEPGVDFVEAIDRAVGSCDVLLVIIGKKWLTCTDASGKKRLDDPKDFIRLETATALRRDIRVIPVLVQDAAMPGEGDLPDDLKKLARRQATEINDTHWDTDTGQLVETLTKLLHGERKPAQSGAGGLVHDPATPVKKPETPRPAPSGIGKNKLTLIISAIMALAVALGGLLYFIPSNKDVAVPELIGISLDEAVARLERERLRPGMVRHMPSERPAGTVIEQDPGPGSRLAPESPVNLVLAESQPDRDRTQPSGEEVRPPDLVLATVPRVEGQMLEQAHRLLERAGLKAAKPVRKETRDAPEGTVIEQSPRAGAKLAQGERVELVVAASPAEPEAEMVRIPDVTKREVREAIALLKEAGLNAKPRMEREENTKAEDGTVLKQSLRPGSRVRPDEAITLVIAVQPRDREAAGVITLPDFTGSPLPKVEAFIKENGLVLGPVKEKETTEQRAGTVVAQRPPAGTRMEKGGKVTLMVAVSGGEQAVLPAPEQAWPEDGRAFDNYPRNLAVRWKPVQGAASYAVELDCLHCCESGKWCSDLGRPWKVAREIPAASTTGYKFVFAGAQPGRWRVWAVDKGGHEGEKSPWRTFRFTK